ncbi:TPA: hypothetical protein ACGPD8_003458 [Klebsiella quasipneumoniae]
MYHLDNTSGVPEMPEPKEAQSITPRWFGESQEQGGISWPGADWFNTVQAELLSILKLAGINPDKASFSQIADAISAVADKAVTLPQGGKIQDAIPYITVEMFSPGDEDAGPAFRAAIATAKYLGIDTVKFNGNYRVTSFDVIPFILPFDDGTVSPVRIERGQDTDVAAEPQVAMPVFINLPAEISLISDDVKTNSITFGWVASPENVSTKQGIGICARVNGWDGSYVATSSSVNRMTTFVTGAKISGFTISSVMIGYLSDGVQQFTDWDTVRFFNCGFPVLFQGADCGHIDNMQCIACYTSLVSGGWWLQRNDVGYRGGVHVPPYISGGGIFSVGWTDNLHINKLLFQGKDKWDSTYVALDNFFEKCFWKTSSAATRLTRYGPDLTTVSTLEASNPYRGVISRALVLACRYNRDNGGNILNDLKVLFCSRVPVFINPAKTNDWGGNIVIYNAFLERTGTFDKDKTTGSTVGGDNDFYAISGDVWNADRDRMPYSVIEGPGVVNNVKFTSAVLTQVSQWAPPVLSPQQFNYVYTKDNADTSQFLRRTGCRDDAANWTIPETLYPDRYQVPAIVFSGKGTNPLLYFKHLRRGLSRPVLYAGSISTESAIAPSSYRGTVELRDGRILVKCAVTLPSAISQYSGILYVGFKELNNFFPYEVSGQTWAVPGVFLRVSSINLNQDSKQLGSIVRADRTYASSPVAETFNNFSFRFGNDVSSQQLQWHHLSSESNLVFEIEYDTDSTISHLP